jgi:hypothetical protein
LAIDRNIRARAFAYLRAYNVKHRIEGQHVGPLTRTCRDVLRALLWLTDRCRAVSYQAIAAEAGCSLDSVWRALTRLKASGLLAWSNRYAWNDRHRKVVRTLNEYRWLEPVMPKSDFQKVPLTSQDSSGASQVMGAEHDRLDAAIGRLLALKLGG